MREWINNAREIEESHHRIMSFDQFLDDLEQQPLIHLRTSAHYIREMLEHYKKEKNGSFKLFTTKHPEAPAVYGQKGAQIERPFFLFKN